MIRKILIGSLSGQNFAIWPDKMDSLQLIVGNCFFIGRKIFTCTFLFSGQNFAIWPDKMDCLQINCGKLLFYR